MFFAQKDGNIGWRITFDNEETRAAVRKYQHRLVGIAWVTPWEGAKAVDEAKRYIESAGFKGIKLHPLLHAFVANEEVVHPIAEAAKDLDVPLFIYSGRPPFPLPWSIAQLAEVFPEVKIVMIHMGPWPRGVHPGGLSLFLLPWKQLPRQELSGKTKKETPPSLGRTSIGDTQEGEVSWN
ncbi:amidohydrolase family protein [Gelria sp. Kuro-4]|uniref:amidohydrolase family protein n=1 Tax=Gelria sp. Kuro-4 TaxID=2796927 RepID=UPI001C81B4A6